jgi:hypothetical protein
MVDATRARAIIRPGPGILLFARSSETALTRICLTQRAASAARIATNTATSPFAWSGVTDPDAKAVRTADTACDSAGVAAEVVADDPMAVTATETALTTPPGRPDAVSTFATAAPAAWPFAGDGLVIELAIAAPAAGGIVTVIEPPPEVVRDTVPDVKPDTTAAVEVVTVPLTLPELLTVMPAAFGAAEVPPAGAPAVADGVLAPGVGFGENVPPAVPELEPVFTPLLSEPLFVGAELKLAWKPRCADADGATTAVKAIATAHAAAARIAVFILRIPEECLVSLLR